MATGASGIIRGVGKCVSRDWSGMSIAGLGKPTQEMDQLMALERIWNEKEIYYHGIQHHEIQISLCIEDHTF